jgi:hypothetical protein
MNIRDQEQAGSIGDPSNRPGTMEQIASLARALRGDVVKVNLLRSSFAIRNIGDGFAVGRPGRLFILRRAVCDLSWLATAGRDQKDGAATKVRFKVDRTEVV